MARKSSFEQENTQLSASVNFMVVKKEAHAYSIQVDLRTGHDRHQAMNWVAKFKLNNSPRIWLAIN